MDSPLQFNQYDSRRLIAACIVALLASAWQPSGASSQFTASNDAVVWATGDVDESGPPEGLLLSDNKGYWGEVLLSGVTYRYQKSDGSQSEVFADRTGGFGRLLNGDVGGGRRSPAGREGEPISVLFDFQRPCTFSEVSIFSIGAPLTLVRVEIAFDEKGEWSAVYDQRPQTEAGSQPTRVRLPAQSRGRYLRLHLESAGTTDLAEVLVWGSGEVSDNNPEQIEPTYNIQLDQGMLWSIPGMKATTFSRNDFDEWLKSIAHHANSPAVWAPAEKPNPLRAVLPNKDSINTPLQMIVARNETETALLTLTNTSPSEKLTLKVQDVEMQQDGVASSSLTARLLVGGALPHRPPERRLTREQRLRLMIDGEEAGEEQLSGDIKVLPFFDKDQLLGSSLMRRYLSNGADIADYPELTLQPGGSAVIMLKLTTHKADAGRYLGSLLANTAAGSSVAMELTVDVADIVLPEIDLWVRSWGKQETLQFPFETQLLREKNVRGRRDLGVTVWDYGLPTPGSKAELFGAHGRTYYHVMGIPGQYIHGGYQQRIQPEDLTAADEERIVAHLERLVLQTKDLGLDFDDWFIELWDEPQEGNAATYGAIARIIKEAQPSIRIYMNPLFWRPGFAPQEVVVESLKDFYNELIDVSVPIDGLVGDNLSTRELWSKPRFVRAMFIHPARRAGRQMAWKAFDLGFNGWAYYCYYAPRGNPWDIRTWRELDYSYQMIFPGPQGPITTPIYEEMRDGWEDYRLLYALRKLGREDLVAELLQEYRNGQPLHSLRSKAMRQFIRH